LGLGLKSSLPGKLDYQTTIIDKVSLKKISQYLSHPSSNSKSAIVRGSCLVD
jgi:hypothetical protein